MLALLGIKPDLTFPQTIEPEKYQLLPLGSIKPAGWLKAQMEKDMNGFVGNLDRLVPDLINDPIYGSGRIGKNSMAKDLGNLKSGNTKGDEQYKWWNSETQSNWWDGFIRNAFLLDDQQAIEKVNNYISRILATQDTDGYLGIYDRQLRYRFSSENGELWSKTTLYRGLLAYYEFTHNEKIWNAIVRAVDNVMKNYPVNESDPFNAGKEYSGGVSHGLTFTDILEKMYQITGIRKYLDYATFLYLDFSKNYSFEKDAQLDNILDSTYKFKSHGVHTYEHLRPLIVSCYASRDPDMQNALRIYLERIRKCTTPAGGPIGDEWISGRNADATNTGYEYCSLQELLDSYCLLYRKSGNASIGDYIENLFYNAAQGSRNPDHSSIAYLKTDNSYEMMGTRNWETETGQKQTRYKYSPVHQDVAVCCIPNAGRISPYFLQSSWLKEGEDALVASLLVPNVLRTTIRKVPVKIEEDTEYPYNNLLIFKISSDKEMPLQIKIRKPGWVKSVKTNEHYQEMNGFIVFDRKFKIKDQIKLEFLTDVQVCEDKNHEKYFTYGALVYARPIPATEISGKTYAPGFVDLYYKPLDTTCYEYVKDSRIQYREREISVSLRSIKTKKAERIHLVPIGETILRQETFR